MTAKTDFERLFPLPEECADSFRAAAPMFSRCPEGHPLPHRQIDGRCTPLYCNDQPKNGRDVPSQTTDNPGYQKYRRENSLAQTMAAELDMVPIGLENEVVNRDINGAADAERIKAQSLEAMELMRAVGRRAAREALHPHPEVPAPPDLKLGAKAYAKKRLDDLTPWLVENEIFEAIYGTATSAAAARSRLMNRAGLTEKPSEDTQLRGPVIVLNAIVSPYEKQKEIVNGAVANGAAVQLGSGGNAGSSQKLVLEVEQEVNRGK